MTYENVETMFFSVVTKFVVFENVTNNSLNVAHKLWTEKP